MRVIKYSWKIFCFHSCTLLEMIRVQRLRRKGHLFMRIFECSPLAIGGAFSLKTASLTVASVAGGSALAGMGIYALELENKGKNTKEMFSAGTAMAVQGLNHMGAGFAIGSIGIYSRYAGAKRGGKVIPPMFRLLLTEIVARGGWIDA